MIPSNKQALELFAELRDMPFSHKSEKDVSGCDLRAHIIYEFLFEHDIENLKKPWIYSPNAPDGHPNYLIKPPVDMYFLEDDENYDDLKHLKSSRLIDNNPFNIHTSVLVPTSDNLELIFDTYFYSHPPEYSQWKNDFKPYEEGVVLGHTVTSPDYLRFAEIGSKLPKEGSWSQLWARSKTHSQVLAELNHLRFNPVDQPLPAKWLLDLQSDLKVSNNTSDNADFYPK